MMQQESQFDVGHSHHRRPQPRLLSVVALLTTLGGCAVGPNYHRPTAEVPTAYKEDQNWKPANPGEIPGNQIWWSIYSDPRLDELEQQVEVSNQTDRKRQRLNSS